MVNDNTDTRQMERALEKGAAGVRLSRAEALALVAESSPHHLHRLGQAALQNRRERYDRRATFVFNLQINPSNICTMGCAFCSYGARTHDDHAYVLSEDQIIRQITETDPLEVHIVGGLNTVWPYARNLALIKDLRQRFPGLHIKAFTAVEIDYFAKTSGGSAETVLAELMAAGMDAMPGGGAELFSRRLRRQYWPNKIDAERWLAIHALAHGMGIPTNATMLFGLGETWPERIDHLLRLRETQDQGGAFQCFIPLPFQASPKGIPAVASPPPTEILAVLAVARLVLDNIPHIKAYWPMTNLETAAAGLSWGADDLDGTIQQERIAHLAGAQTPRGLAREQMLDTIRNAGFDPVERNGVFEPCDPPIVPSNH